MNLLSLCYAYTAYCRSYSVSSPDLRLQACYSIVTGCVRLDRYVLLQRHHSAL